MLKGKHFYKVFFFIVFCLLYNNNTFTQLSGICGNDTRYLSTNSAVGRIVIENTTPIPLASCFLIPNGLLVTAGHVSEAIKSTTYDCYVEFNIPTNGSPVATSNRYKINKSKCVIGGISELGDDWGYFEVEPNSETGDYPITRQGCLSLNTQFPFCNPCSTSAFAIGYSKNPNPAMDYMLQYSNGIIIAHYSGYNGIPPYIAFNMDVDAGASGGTIIVQSQVVGIISKGVCNLYGYNVATSFRYAPILQSPIGIVQSIYVNVKIEQVLESSINKIGNINRWWNNNFIPIINGSYHNYYPQEIITLKADYGVEYDNKFYEWVQATDKRIINNIKITSNLTKITSQFKPTKGLRVKNNFDEINNNKLTSYILFADPWFRDAISGCNSTLVNRCIPLMNINQSPFNLSVSGNHQGVFLNQGWPGWTPPYYSVQTISPQTISLSQTVGHTIFIFRDGQAQMYNFNIPIA